VFCRKIGYNDRMRLPLVLAAATAAALAASAGATPSAPRIAIEHASPLVIHGQHFRTHERIRVTGFVPAATATRTVTASATGSFTVRFPTLKAGTNGCGPYGARAVGSKGAKASVRVLPECAPGPTP
jgi:hypothetical protein